MYKRILFFILVIVDSICSSCVSGNDNKLSHLFEEIGLEVTATADDEQKHDPNLLINLIENKDVTCATILPDMLPLLPRRISFNSVVSDISPTVILLLNNGFYVGSILHDGVLLV